MNENIEKAIKNYQCSGCIGGPFPNCFKKDDTGVGCGGHKAGTYVGGIGNIFLGMPKGFNRLGAAETLKLSVFEDFLKFDWGCYNKWNIPVWKYLNKDGHTLVRGLSPRVNSPFLHVFLEDCMDKIDCREITQEEIDAMD